MLIIAGKIELCGFKITRCDISNGNAVLVSDTHDTHKEIILPVIKLIRICHCAGGKNLDDAPLDEAFRRGRVFQLLADGYLITLIYKACRIGLISVMRNSAHWSSHTASAVPCSQCKLKRLTNKQRVIKEALIEVTESVEDNLLAHLTLQIGILLHHRRKALVRHVIKA